MAALESLLKRYSQLSHSLVSRVAVLLQRRRGCLIAGLFNKYARGIFKRPTLRQFGSDLVKIRYVSVAGLNPSTSSGGAFDGQRDHALRT